MSVSPQTNLAAANGPVGLLARRGSAADGPELWNADHTDAAALDPDRIYPTCLFVSQRVPGRSQRKFGPGQKRPSRPPESECFCPACVYDALTMQMFLQN